HQSTIDTLNDIYKETRNGKIEFYHEDLKNFDAIKAIFETASFDAVIHFAASIVVPESVENPLKYYMNNTVNTTHVIKMCNDYGIKHFIFSSTAAVYGEPSVPQVTETTPTIPINPYGMSKLMSETVLGDASMANSEFSHVILRYFNVAGADVQNRIGQSFPNATHLIKVSAQTAIGDRDKMMIFGEDYDTPDGTCIRDYIHVDDLASAHLRALEYLAEGNESNIFNVGYGRGFSVKEVISTMREVSGVEFRADMAPRRAGDPGMLISNNAKIKSVLSWKPQYEDLALICKTALDWEKNL
ncbi:MAG: UDP-glucose 4-epimerase GalE, partial [Campylobacterota bacterium]|nr:UDP-glucose 4-epimerase GalE [Campylobacterota bacterium]